MKTELLMDIMIIIFLVINILLHFILIKHTSNIMKPDNKKRKWLLNKHMQYADIA